MIKNKPNQKRNLQTSKNNNVGLDKFRVSVS